MNNQKQFGVWMDNHNATIVGSEGLDSSFTVVAHVKGEENSPNSNEKNSIDENGKIRIKAAEFPLNKPLTPCV